MKRYVVIALFSLFAVGCAGTVTKEFKVIADPPDSVIKIVSGVELKEQTYSSPATVMAEVPKDPVLAGKAVLEVRKNKYKPMTLALRNINNGDTIKIKLEKIIRYEVQCRLVAPIKSDEVRFQDNALSIWFTVGEQAFQMNLTNRSDYPLKIVWGSAEYTDIHEQRRRLMHSGMRYQERNNFIPDQIVLPGTSLQEDLTPIEHVYVSPQTKGYEVKPLFSRENLESAGLKGKIFILFIPIEINRVIIPYEFKIEIVNVVNATDKE